MNTGEHKYPVIELFGPTVQGEGALTGAPTHFLRFGGCGYKCTWCDSMHAVDPKQIKQNRIMMTTREIIDTIMKMPKTPWLTLTGGDPCLQPGLEVLIRNVNEMGMKVCVETQGELWPEWLGEADTVTFSPKGPSSGNVTPIDDFVPKFQEFLSKSNASKAVKVVIFNDADLLYAFDLKTRIDAIYGSASMGYRGFYFQVGSPLNSEIPQSVTDVLNSSVKREGVPAETYNRVVNEAKTRWKRWAILDMYQKVVEAVTRRGDLLTHNTYITPQMHVLLWPLEERNR